VKYILFSVLLFSACVSERKRAKICETCPERIEYTVRDSIVRRDSLIQIPGTTIRDTIKIECDERGVPVISIKRPLRSGNVAMNITRPDVNTIVSECIIDSTAVAISWNEKHTSQREVKVITEGVKGIVWHYALIVSILTFIIGFIYGRYKADKI
jgi:hypothetical protein